MRSVKHEGSSTHANLMELKRSVRDLTEKVNGLDEQNETLDLTDLEGRNNITVSDVVASMKTLQ